MDFFSVTLLVFLLLYILEITDLGATEHWPLKLVDARFYQVDFKFQFILNKNLNHDNCV